MKKVLISILLIAALLEAVAFLVFTSSGNALLLPYLNSYLKSNVDGTKVELTKLQLKPGHVTVFARVNDSVDVAAKGPIDLLDQHFDLQYKIDAQKVESEEIKIDKEIHVLGKVKGKMEDMHITGRGEAFDSIVYYDLNLLNNQPQNIKLDLKDASIAEVLATLKQKSYAKGRMSIHIDMPVLDPQNPQGQAHLQIKDALIDAVSIKQEYNISLPSKSSLNADITATAKGETLLAKGDIISSLAKLTLSETNFHLNTQKWDTRYLLDIPDLSKLKGLIQTPLRGKLTMKGGVSHQEDQIKATGQTRSLGGQSKFIYNKDTLKATLTDVDATKLLALLAQPMYANGKLSANVTLDSIKNLTGKFNLKGNGLANSTVLKKELELDLGKSFNYKAVINGKIKNQKLYSSAKLNTPMANLNMPDIRYDLTPGALRSSYHIYIPDLVKLHPLTQRKFRGDMDFSGQITQEKDLIITGQGKEFDGSVSYKLVNDQIKADVKGATVSKVMYMLGYPQVLEALSEAKVDYNFTTKRGKVDAKLDSARILSNQLTRLLKQFTKIDLTKERYNQATFVSTMTPTKINFDFIAQNLLSHFKIINGVLDKRSDRINASVDMKYKDKDIKAKISGTLQKPQVKLDTSAYLKSKVEKKVDKLLEKQFKGKGEEKIKGLLKGLF